MILDWIVCLVCGGGSIYCLVTMPEKIIFHKKNNPFTATEPKGSRIVLPSDGASARPIKIKGEMKSE